MLVLLVAAPYEQLPKRLDVHSGIRTLIMQTERDCLEHSLIILPDSSYLGESGTQDSDRVTIPPEAISFVHTHPATIAYPPSAQDVRNELELAKTHPGFVMYVVGTKRMGYNNEITM
jgi:hypothetical protein